jgi:acyl-CoA synthetase (NDP forming)
LMAENDIKAIFEPNSVVLIGSSEVGEDHLHAVFFRSIVQAMRRFYKGKVYVVDLSGQLEDTSRNFKALPNKLDLAVLTLQPEQVLNCARKLLGRSAIKAMVLISSGFTEDQAEQLLRATVKHGIRVLGPGIVGVVNTSNGLCLMPRLRTMPRQGAISFIVVDQGIGPAMLDWAHLHGIGVGKFAAIEGSVDVDTVEAMRYLAEDKSSRVICVYAEKGSAGGRRFLQALREVSKLKPVVAFGRDVTRATLARPSIWEGKIFSAALRQAGAIRAGNMQEFFDMAEALAKQPPMKGDGIAIVGTAEGPAMLAADAVRREGFELARLSDGVIKSIKRRYPDVCPDNPINLGPNAGADCYEFVLGRVLRDPQVDGVMVVIGLNSCQLEPKEMGLLSDVARKVREKPIVGVTIGGDWYIAVRDVLRGTDVPVYDLPERGVKALRALRWYGKLIEKRNMTKGDRRVALGNLRGIERQNIFAYLQDNKII